MNEELLYYIWLNRIRGIGPILANNLMEYFENISEVYRADMFELLKVNGIGEKLANKLSKAIKTTTQSTFNIICKRTT